MQSTEQRIRGKALSLGYEACGIVPLSRLGGYGERLAERIGKDPASERFYRNQKRLAEPLASYPWAKSAVVAAGSYAKYRVPPSLKGRIGRHYMFDARADFAPEAGNNRAMEEYLTQLGMQVATNRKFGVVGLRWAAMQAGIGIVRRNNFLYTQSGSRVYLDAWLIDRKMELTETPSLPPCPKNCDRCIKSCPTGSLFAPYAMSPPRCVSFLTTFGGRDLIDESLADRFGDCIYGCDICQDVCPMNRGTQEGIEDYPGLGELAPALEPEAILQMGEAFYRAKIQPRFFYLGPDELWKWQLNALCFMDNRYDARYAPHLILACGSLNEKVSELARELCRRHGLAQGW